MTGPDPGAAREAASQSGHPEVRASLETSLRRLARAIGWLRWPSLLLVVGALVPALWILAMGLTWRPVPRLLAIAFAAAVAVAAWLFLRSRAGVLRAVHDPAALVRDLTNLESHTRITLEFARRLADVVTGSRIGLLRRLRAMWGVVTIPSDAVEYVQELPALGWLVPPRIMSAWARTLAVLWLGLSGWVLAPILSGLALSPLL